MDKKKALIVDDNIRNRFLLSEMLEDIGLQTMQAENGKIAIDLMLAHEFDLILLDIEMPVMNGIETALHIKTEMGEPFNKIPIIFITAHNIDDYFSSFNQKIYDDVITKPHTVETLLKKLDKYIR